MRSVEGKRDGLSKTELCATAKAHLRDHPRAESSAAIRKHQMAENAAEIIVPADDFGRLPTDEWRDHATAWLPETTASPADAADPLLGSSDGTTSVGPNAED
ncbi:hypothetical protein [Halorubrum sp. N11]|uniref:hypothetical protein n=1 Tax=Halorubrum sp. N11 TaxID=3402276 RepID=UPI003EBF29C2